VDWLQNAVYLLGHIKDKQTVLAALFLSQCDSFFTVCTQHHHSIWPTLAFAVSTAIPRTSHLLHFYSASFSTTTTTTTTTPSSTMSAAGAHRTIMGFH
jgi:hypothetical protein